MYGTLRPGQDNDEARRLAQGSRHVASAYVRGRVVQRDGFPALVIEPHGRVDGDLLLVQDDGLWDHLDAYEGVGATDAYRRELVVAIDQRGDTRSAWAYTARQP